jgi:hypothetical protein
MATLVWLQFFAIFDSFRRENWPPFFAIFCEKIFKIITSVPGVDVMITVFGEKLGVFLSNQRCDQIFSFV